MGRRDGQSGPWLELNSSSRVPPFLPMGTLGPLPLPVGAQGCLERGTGLPEARTGELVGSAWEGAASWEGRGLLDAGLREVSLGPVLKVLCSRGCQEDSRRPAQQGQQW